MAKVLCSDAEVVEIDRNHLKYSSVLCSLGRVLDSSSQDPTPVFVSSAVMKRIVEWMQLYSKNVFDPRLRYPGQSYIEYMHASKMVLDWENSLAPSPIDWESPFFEKNTDELNILLVEATYSLGIHVMHASILVWLSTLVRDKGPFDLMSVLERTEKGFSEKDKNELLSKYMYLKNQQ